MDLLFGLYTVLLSGVLMGAGFTELFPLGLESRIFEKQDV